MTATPPMCRCVVPAVLRTSWTDANPGRRFFGCANYRGVNACNYFRWIDPPLEDNIKRLVLALHKRIREVERRNNHSSFVREMSKSFFIVVGTLLAKSVIDYLFGNM
ncbi:unnamed protein product [Linum tenue]|uniref:GRF-type domain-containing protein n=1 Tax=Linum tenue TaxID=586396 RepID=A0AAV0L7Q4_9ROSI|nr:unnamed protein product [Linum tenue]